MDLTGKFLEAEEKNSDVELLELLYLTIRPQDAENKYVYQTE